MTLCSEQRTLSVYETYREFAASTLSSPELTSPPRPLICSKNSYQDIFIAIPHSAY